MAGQWEGGANGGAAYTLRNIVSNASVAVTFAANPYGPLTLLINGNGTVTPSLYGQQLLVGKTYTLTAHPAAGSLFSNWLADGVVVDSYAQIDFRHAAQPGLAGQLRSQSIRARRRNIPGPVLLLQRRSRAEFGLF